MHKCSTLLVNKLHFNENGLIMKEDIDLDYEIPNKPLADRKYIMELRYLQHSITVQYLLVKKHIQTIKIIRHYIE